MTIVQEFEIATDREAPSETAVPLPHLPVQVAKHRQAYLAQMQPVHCQEAVVALKSLASVEVVATEADYPDHFQRLASAVLEPLLEKH